MNRLFNSFDNYFLSENSRLETKIAAISLNSGTVPVEKLVENTKKQNQTPKTMTTHIDMRLASTRINTDLFSGNAMPRLYTPGEIITSEQGFMR